MALFAMLFGTRRAAATEHNRGLVLAVAFESLIKLAAMLAVGACAIFGMHDGLADRRYAIAFVVLLAWAYSRAMVASEALADIGALSAAVVGARCLAVCWTA